MCWPDGSSLASWMTSAIVLAVALAVLSGALGTAHDVAVARSPMSSVVGVDRDDVVTPGRDRPEWRTRFGWAVL